MTETNDQRRSPRCEVDLFVEEFADGRSYLHPAIDLSQHGIYILMEDSRRAVDGLRDVHIQFKLPGGHVVETHGRIVHVDDHRGRRGARIAFYTLNEVDERAILALIESSNTAATTKA